MPPEKKSSKTTKSSASQIEETRVQSKRITEDELLNTAGASGTYIVNGFLETDYNAKLSGNVGLEKYDEMRRADSQVRASLMVCMLPILSTEWYVEPAKNEETGEAGEEEQEIAKFCEKALFEKMEITWQNHMTEVLTMLPFGFSVFEKVYRADEGDEFIWIKKLGFRKQTTVQKWETEDGAAGITQQLPTQITDPTSENVGKSQVSIPASKLLLFSYQKEGDNYAGISILRSAYKHWYIKDRLYTFDTVKHERQGVGIPCIKLPKGATDADKAEARAILKNIRVNEQGGVILPNPEWEFMFVDIQAGNTSDMWKSIDHHNREIVKNVLAQFLELGNTESGSRALSEDQSDFFLLALEALANMIEDVYNRFLIPELVDLNFDVMEYPKLRHRRLGNVDYSTLTNVIASAAGAGVVTPDTDLEDWFRKIIDAPPRLIEEEEPLEEEIDPETGLPYEDELPIDDADLEEAEPEELTDEELLQQEEAEAVLDDEEATDEEVVEAAEVFISLQEKALGFRIVSEATKRRISEALKGRKRGGAIAARREQRLKKAGRSITPKSQEAAKARIRDAMNTVGTTKPVAKPAAKKVAKPKLAKPKKVSKALKKATKQLKQKSKATRKTVKTSPAVATPKKKSGGNTLTLRKKQQAGDQNSALYKKKGVKAHEHHEHEEYEPNDYDRIFGETAEHIMNMQRAMPIAPDSPKPHVRRFAEPNNFKTWRPLTFAEEKVNWKSLRKSMGKFEQALDGEINSITADQKADLLSQVKRAVEGNDIAAIGTLKAKYTGDLSSALTNVQKEMFELGKNSAALEMGIKAPGTAREVMGALKVGNDKVVSKLTSDMENAAAQAVTQTVAKRGGSITSTNAAEAVGAASAAIDKVIEAKGQLNTLTIMGTVNLGRASIFERYPEQVYGFQYSAIIDDRTTDIYLSLDGRVVKAGSPDFYKYSPPRHYNCRSIWVEILEDEEFKPDTGSIPARIPANATIDTFEDLNQPVVDQNSPAVKVLQRELEEREAKVKEYEDSGLFQNRIDAHKERIDAINRALTRVDDLTSMSIDISASVGNPKETLQKASDLFGISTSKIEQIVKDAGNNNTDIESALKKELGAKYDQTVKDIQKAVEEGDAPIGALDIADPLRQAVYGKQLPKEDT